MKNETNPAFAKALRTLRKGSKMSQYALSNATDLDRSYISLLERGLRSPTLDTMVKLARALNVSLPEMAIAIDRALRAEQEIQP